MGSKVQAVLFDRERWSPKQAEAWLSGRNMTPIKNVHATENYLRYRMRDPGEFDHFTTLPVYEGVKMVIGWPEPATS
jgi:hypothetical protein